MGYINKLVSCYEVINRVERTFKPQGSSWIREAIEDFGWSIQAIGYHGGFEKTSTPYPYLVVQNHQVKIPCNVERIIAVEQLLPSPSLNNQNVLNPDGTTPFQEYLTQQTFPADIDDNDSTERGIIQNEDLAGYNPNSPIYYQSVRLRLGSDLTSYGLVDPSSPRTTGISPNADYYNVNNNNIITSFCDGLIKLHTVGFALDDRGYPKIVDDFDYKSCLEWGVYKDLLFKGYKNPNISYKDAFQMFEMYRLRAENAIKVQNLDAAERFLSSWSRYVQDSQVGNDFFMNNEQRVFINMD